MSAKRFSNNDVPEMKEFALFPVDAMVPIHVNASRFELDSEKGALTLFGEDGKTVSGLFLLDKITGIVEAASLVEPEYDEEDEETWPE